MNNTKFEYQIEDENSDKNLTGRMRDKNFQMIRFEGRLSPTLDE